MPPRRGPLPVVLAFVVIVLCGSVPTRAQAPAPPGSARDDTDGGAAAALDRVLPEVNFDNVPLEDLVDYLRDVSGLQAVVVREENVPGEFPVIRLRLKQVPLRQLLDVLQTAYPQISIEPVEADGRPTVHIIRVEAPPEAGGGGEPGDLAAGMALLARGAWGGRAGAAVVRVYPLSQEIQLVTRNSGTVGPGGPEPEGIKKTLDDVVSLIKGAFDASGGGGAGGNAAAPTLAVHDATQTLIVTGTPEQHALVSDTLAALRGDRTRDVVESQASDRERRLRERHAATEEQVDRLRQELEAARNEARRMQDLYMERNAELERLRVRLEAWEQDRGRTGRPGGGGGGGRDSAPPDTSFPSEGGSGRQ